MELMNLIIHRFKSANSKTHMPESFYRIRSSISSLLGLKVTSRIRKTYQHVVRVWLVVF